MHYNYYAHQLNLIMQKATNINMKVKFFHLIYLQFLFLSQFLIFWIKFFNENNNEIIILVGIK